MENIFVEFLPPWVETGLQPAFYDKESGTVLQQTARMYARVNMLIRMFNKLSKQTKETVEDYINQFNELHTYVQDYFDNLDVQEEINNKLDEMAESGLFTDILSNYAYKNLDVADNYRITTERIEDTARTLIYHISRIHPNEGKAEYVKLKGKFSQDNLQDTITGENKAINMFEFSKKINATLVSNSDTVGALRNVVIIREGEVLRQDALSTDGTLCGFNDTGDLKVYSNCMSATPLLADNIVNTWRCSILINNGQVDSDDWATVTDNTKNNQHPRTIMLQEYNSKDVVFLHIEGRKPTSTGVTFAEACTLIFALFPSVNNAVIFGGGGDSQLMINGRMKNDSNDDQLRPLHDIIYLDPNLVYDDNEASREIANARNLDVTLHGMLKDRINLTDNLIYANRIMDAVVVSATEEVGTIHLACNIDYNTTLEVNDSVLIRFPDLSGYPDASSVRLNIHYADTVNTPYLRHHDNTVAQPVEISEKICLCTWNGTNYVLDDDNIIINVSSNAVLDLDEYKETGTYYSTHFTNTPSSTFTTPQATGFLKVYKMPLNNVIYQEYHTIYGANYIRTFSSNAWNAWYLMTNDRPASKNNLDLNDIAYSNVIGYGNNFTNKPANAGNGWIMNVGGASAAYGVQLFFERETDSSSGRVFIRFKENNVWTAWKQFAFTS